MGSAESIQSSNKLLLARPGLPSMASIQQVLPQQQYDLATCDQEPIQIPGAIQPHGVLLILGEPDFQVIAASVNTLEYLGLNPDQVVGIPVEHLFAQSHPGDVEQILRKADLNERPLYLQTMQAKHVSARFDLTAYRSRGTLVIELEPTRSPMGASFHQLYPLVSHLVENLRSASSVGAIAQLAADEVKRLTNFGRVLVYKFDPDWNGQVIAESREDDYASYLGLWFPASDIPQQARRLYQLNRLRLIADASYLPVPLHPSLNPSTGESIDLSFAALRSVSPIHLEYLKNMGVRASMSMSLLTNEGTLWGLIGCHHRTPKLVPLELRTACDLLALTVSAHLEFAERQDVYQQRISLTSVATRLLGFLAEEDEFLPAFVNHPDEVLELGCATGAAVLYGGVCACLGNCPPEPEIWQLAAWLVATGRKELFYTDALPSAIPDGESYREPASGILAISISSIHPNYIVWFRPEVIQTVNWSGDPRKRVENMEQAPERLHPRKSFEVWKETVRGRSVPWSQAQVQTISELRNAIMGVVLRKAEELAAINADLQRSNKELEAFSSSVSHDLRVPFRHILGFSELLKASSAGKLSPKERHYIDVLIDSANFAGTVIDNLLAFSQLGRAKLKFSLVNMNELVTGVQDDLAAEVKNRAVQWNIAKLPEVDGDSVLLRLVWQNLIQNAVKFTRHRDQTVIDVGAMIEGDEFVFSVRDNGVGFNPTYSNKLFGVFQRLHRKDEFAGNGIGLANVRRIIARHGGRTWAVGEVNAGATFFFSLPTQR